jgi:hypothetical protein
LEITEMHRYALISCINMAMNIYDIKKCYFSAGGSELGILNVVNI